MFEDELLVGLRPAPPGSSASAAVRVQVRLPWYRSLPLSCIERLGLTIDGEVQPQDRLTLVINGDGHPLAAVPGLHEVWWFVLDAVDVEVDAVPPLAPGTHEVGVAMELRIPYGDPDFRPDLNIRQVAECTKALTLAGRDE